METLERCSAMAPQYVPMLSAKASLLSSKGMDDEALGYLNAAVANDPGNAEALLARAAVLKRLGNFKLVGRDLGAIALLDDELYNFRGIAMSEMNRDDEAFKWLQSITSTPQAGGENFFYAAVLMALRGDNFKALDYTQKAIDNGFGSLYRLQYDELSPLNLKSLRAEPAFQLLMDKALRNFMESE